MHYYSYFMNSVTYGSNFKQLSGTPPTSRHPIIVANMLIIKTLLALDGFKETALAILNHVFLNHEYSTRKP